MELHLLDIYLKATEVMQHGVMWLNDSGQILGFNPHFAKELGYKKDNFKPKTIFEVNPYLNFIEWQKTWQDLLGTRQIAIETEHINADGQTYPVKMRGVLYAIEDRNYCCAIVENLLETNKYEDLLNLTSEVSRVGGWEWDLVNDSFILTNQVFKLLNIPAEHDLKLPKIQQLIAERLAPEEARLLQEKTINAIKSGEGYTLEVTVKIDASAAVFSRMRLITQVVTGDLQTVKFYGTIQDVSDIQERTEDLYLTEYCMNHAQSMIFWVRPDATIYYANESAQRILGYTKSELTKMSILDFSDRKATKEDWDTHWQELETQKFLEFETFNYSKEGEEIPVLVTAHLIEYQGKKYNCAFVKDWRKKKKRDEQLEIFQFSIENAVDMIFWLDEHGHILMCNEAAAKNLGYSKSDLQKLTVFDIAPQNSPEKWPEKYQTIQENKFMTYESLHKRKDGSQFQIEVSLNHLSINDKPLICVFTRDITTRKKKQTQLEIAYEQISHLKSELETENIVLKEEIDLDHDFGNIVSKSENYKPVLRQIQQVADTDATVLVLGETGTGKELLARAIHQLSDRADRTMIKVNCGALPANLIESELFGHEKGAFTGAYQQKKGRFEIAHKGTIFLDEMGELPLDLQAKLLRVLQEGEFERVGGTQTIQVDVRVIAATNRDLEKRVREGKFREDLFYRLNVFPIRNVPLRERRDDIPLLVKHFAKKFAKKMNKEALEIPQSLIDKLMKYEFPGNVRELENMMERAMILSKGRKLQLDSVLFKNTTGKTDKTFKTLEQIQRNHILKALKRTNGRVSGESGAARLLGLPDKTLFSKIKKLKIEKSEYV